jgi:hypothetical protein
VIEMVQTPHGIISAATWKRMQAEDEARRLKHGMGGKDIARLERAAARLRAKFTPDELARAYPCRTCKTCADDRYRSACAETRATPCYFAHGMRGCVSWQPKPIVA